MTVKEFVQGELNRLLCYTYISNRLERIAEYQNDLALYESAEIITVYSVLSPFSDGRLIYKNRSNAELIWSDVDLEDVDIDIDIQEEQMTGIELGNLEYCEDW